jgi:cytochrome P450
LTPSFKRWSGDAAEVLGGTLTEQCQVDVNTSLIELAQYFADRSEERRVRPGSDFLSSLIAAEKGGLMTEEIIAIAYVVLVAGNETTVNLLSSVWRTPACSSGSRPTVRGPRIVREALRLESPIQGFPRRVLRDTEISGFQVPAGAQVM